MTDDELVERMFAVYHTPGKTAEDVLAFAKPEIERALLQDMKEWADERDHDHTRIFFAYFHEYLHERGISLTADSLPR